MTTTLDQVFDGLADCIGAPESVRPRGSHWDHLRELHTQCERRRTDPAWKADPIWGPLAKSLSWNQGPR